MIAVKELDDKEMHRFYGRRLLTPLAGYAARRGPRTVAIGGLTIGTDGKVWGFIDFKPGYRLRAIYRYVRKLMAWAEWEGIPEIWVSRDRALETSERLLTRSGFERSDEEIEGYEIWVWRNKKVEKNV